MSLETNKFSRIINSSNGKVVEIESVETAYNGFFKMLKYKLRHSLFNGGLSSFFTREVMIRPNAVAVILFDPNTEEVVLVNQFRVGAIEEANPWVNELVAGVMEDGEEPEDVARREVFEETGIQLDCQLKKIGEYMGSVGGLNEKTTIFYAQVNSTDCGGIHGLDNENEDILVVKKHASELFEDLASQKTMAASLMIGAFWLEQNFSELIS